MFSWCIVTHLTTRHGSIIKCVRTIAIGDFEILDISGVDRLTDRTLVDNAHINLAASNRMGRCANLDIKYDSSFLKLVQPI